MRLRLNNQISRPLLLTAMVIMLLVMIIAYAIASSLTSNYSVSEENILLQSAQHINQRTASLYEQQRAAAQRIVLSNDIADAVRNRRVSNLHGLLENAAELNNVDTLVIIDAQGIEIAGVARIDTGNYSVSTDSDYSAIMGDDAAIFETARDIYAFVALPLADDATVFVGQSLTSIIQTLRSSAVSNIALYRLNGTALQSSFPLDAGIINDISLEPSILAAAQQSTAPIFTSITIRATPYRALYAQLQYNEIPLGIAGTFVVDNIPFATVIGRQLMALLAAVLAGVAVIGIMGGGYYLYQRFAEPTSAASIAPSQSAPTRSLGDSTPAEVVAALDESPPNPDDKFSTMLRRQRRERHHLLSALESVTSGVIVQDKERQAIFINDTARDLLNIKEDAQQALAFLQEIMPEVLGTVLAVGIYELGEPQRIVRSGKVLTVEAAAILSPAGSRLGTIILLRDSSNQAREEQEHAELLTQLSQDIQQPLSELAYSNIDSVLDDFARDISRHAIALQKMVIDMRDVTQYERANVEQKQRALSAETLLLAVANDWRQIAHAAGIELRLIFEEKGLYILGDESRLRWAIGNLVDNAIKYTAPGGALTLEIKAEQDESLHMRVRDNGVGISAEDLAHIFEPFYRGTPITTDGHEIKVPGMGQGLKLAKQIIEAHNGMIKVKSKLGVGTAVYFALPITSETGYQLPIFDDELMEGATVMISEDLDLDSWQN